MDLKLKDKVVVVTGSAGIKGSIGETIVQRLADEGAIPALIDRNDRGFGYVEELQSRGIDAVFCKTDVTDPDQIEKAVKTIAESKFNGVVTSDLVVLPGVISRKKQIIPAL